METNPYYYREMDLTKSTFERIFIFSLIWSFGGVCDEDSRQLFDKVLRELMQKNEAKCVFPNVNTVFDYFPDIGSQAWTPWTDGQSGIGLTSRKPIEQQLIPTNESASMMYISRLLVMHEKHTYSTVQNHQKHLLSIR